MYTVQCIHITSTAGMVCQLPRFESLQVLRTGCQRAKWVIPDFSGMQFFPA